MPYLAQTMAVLRRPSPAELHLETTSGGEPAELVRLSLSASSDCRLFIAAVYYFNAAGVSEARRSASPAMHRWREPRKRQRSHFRRRVGRRASIFSEVRAGEQTRFGMAALAVRCSVGYRSGYGSH